MANTPIKLGPTVSPPGQFNVQSYGAVGNGIANDTAAIQAAIDAAQVAGGAVLFPTGEYAVDLSGVADPGYAISVPSGVVLRGDGQSSKILMVGVVGTPAIEQKVIFRVIGPAQDVTFDGLVFIGENNPFELVQQNQSACIELWENSYLDIKDVIVTNCVFKNLWGFSIHSPGSSLRCHVTHCLTIECANGINVNGDDSYQCFNTIYKSEGFEAAGNSINISHNIFKDVYNGAISCGGETEIGAKRRGCIVTHNIINGSTEGGGRGIVINDAICNGIVSNNTVRGTYGYAILIAKNFPESLNFGHIISDNNIVNCCGLGSPELAGIIVGGDSCVIRGNRVVDDDVADDFNLQFGIFISSNNNVIIGNYLDTTNYDLSFQSDTVGNVQAHNTMLATQQVYYAGTDSQDPLLENGKVGTAYYEKHKVALNPFYTFARRYDGKMEWGPGDTGPADTNLYRSAADTLKTDDTFVAGAGLTIGTQKLVLGAAAPVAGTWALGDTVINTAPAAGSYWGWVCVSPGTPGTWKTFGPISS
jgi:hypothetical protein